MPLLIFWSVWCATALVASAVLTRQLIGWAMGRGVIDVPNARSSHTRATPRGGGLAIVGVVTVAAALAVVLHPESMVPIAGVLLPSLAIASVSWLDDVRPLKNRTRLSIHMLAAVAATATLGPVCQVNLGSFGTFDLGLAAWPLTLLWIIGLTNAFNFMDGIDGIAGITATVSGLAIAVAASFFGATAVAAVAAAFAAASLGFLSCNWQPAKIFMGDVGSAFCGFLLAVLPMAVPLKSEPAVASVCVVALWPFIFDTASTLLYRLWKRENIFRAHRSHLYQRLTIAGWSHRGVASLYGGISAMSGMVAIAPLFDPLARAAADRALLAVMVICMALLVALVLVAERREGIPAGEVPHA